MRRECVKDESVRRGSVRRESVRRESVRRVSGWLALRLRKHGKKQGRPTRHGWKKICDEINTSFDVEGLCRNFLESIAKLVDREGGRLSE